jgi:cytoskeletal protein RodZ
MYHDIISFMFGLGNRNNDQNTQIPYEVYETVQEPTYRRRRWVIRLVAALVVVTLLIFGISAIRNALKDDNGGTPSTGQSQSGSGQQGNKDVLPPESVNQSPEQNTPGSGAGSDPSTTPQSGTDNNSTVRKPE